MRAFAGVLGQNLAIEGLQRMLDSGQLRQSLLFEGPSGVGKQLVASCFAAACANRHDIHHLRPEGISAQHTIDAMRDLAGRVQVRGYDKSPSVFIIHSADRMPLPAANALLKTFEEPPERVILALLTSCGSDILATVRSRCLRVPFLPLGPSDLTRILSDRQIDYRSSSDLDNLLRFGRAGFAVRYFETTAKLRIANLMRLLQFPLTYRDFKRCTETLDRQSAQYIEEISQQTKQEMDRQEVVSSLREQALRFALARAQLHLQEEFQYFASSLLDLANRAQLSGEAPWTLFPLQQLASHLQRAQLLLQRGGRLGQLLESTWLTWRLLS